MKEKAASNGAAGTKSSVILCSRLILRSDPPKTAFVAGGRQFHIHLLFNSVCQEYFLDGGMKRMLEKDEKSSNVSMSVTALSASPQPYSTICR